MRRRRRGFSLVEVAVALSVVAFSVLAIVALLPIGIKSNQVSLQEARAMDILTGLEADLRNSYPSKTGKSNLFLLTPPYMVNTVTSRLVYNTSIAANQLYTTALDENESPAAAGGSARYQASVIYLTIPHAGSLATLEAHLVVSWPAVTAPTASSITTPSTEGGFVETYVAFRAP